MYLFASVDPNVMRILENIVLWRRHIPVQVRLEVMVFAANFHRPPRCLWVAGACTLVVQNADTLSIRLVRWVICLGELAKSRVPDVTIEVLCAHPVFAIIRSSLISMYDDTITLTDAHRERIRPEGLDRHIIRRHNLEHVVVDRELEVEVDGAIGNSKQVFLVLFQRLLEIGPCTELIVASDTIERYEVGLGCCRRSQ